MFNIVSVTNQGSTIEVLYEVMGSNERKKAVIQKKREGLLRPVIDGEIKRAIEELLKQIE